MLSRKYTERSFFIKFIQKIQIEFYSFKHKINNIYSFSLTNRIKKRSFFNLKLYYSNSILKKIYDFITENDDILKDSKAIRWLTKGIKKNFSLLSSSSKNLTSGSQVGKIQKMIPSITLQTIGIFIISIILTYSLLSLLLKRGIVLSGWLCLGFFLLLGCTGIFSKASWADIEQTSFLLKYFNNSCKK